MYVSIVLLWSAARDWEGFSPCTWQFLDIYFSSVSLIIVFIPLKGKDLLCVQHSHLSFLLFYGPVPVISRSFLPPCLFYHLINGLPRFSKNHSYYRHHHPSLSFPVQFRIIWLVPKSVHYNEATTVWTSQLTGYHQDQWLCVQNNFRNIYVSLRYFPSLPS